MHAITRVSHCGPGRYDNGHDALDRHHQAGRHDHECIWPEQRSSYTVAPYALTLTSIFDSDDPWARDYGSSYGGKVEIEFRIGTQVYHYEGPANSDVDRTSVSLLDSYQHHIWFNTNSVPDTGFTVHFYNEMYYFPGDTGQEGPLVPLYADEKSSKNVFGHSSVVMYPFNPDLPYRWSMDGTVATVSVQVAAVPEPVQYAMFGVGLLALALWRRGVGHAGRHLICEAY